MTRRTVAALAAIGLLGGCGPSSEVVGAERASVEIYVLVDLSETWLNPTSTDRNRRVLREVGEGISSYARLVDGPVLVEHREIGASSLLTEPLCTVFYKRSIALTNSHDSERIAQPQRLRRYLVEHCPEQILSHPAEPLTEISAAVASIAAEPTTEGVERFLIIASDFLEETPNVTPLAAGSLRQSHIMMLYRPVSDDQGNPRGMSTRVESWKEELEQAGAVVAVAPDPSIRRSRIATFLSQPRVRQ